LREAPHQIQISLRMSLVRNGTKYQGFGGIQLKDYLGRWLESQQRMDVSLGRFNLRINNSFYAHA